MIEKYKNLITQKGTLNSAIISSLNFKNSLLCQELINDTKCLDIFSDISINDRASFLIHNLKFSYCKVCNKPYIIINQKRHKLCNHRQIFKLKTCYKVERNNLINNYLKNHNFKNLLFSDSEKKDLTEKLLKLSSIKNIFNTNKQLFDFLIKETINLLPNISIESLKERLYIFKKGLKEIPKCNVCRKKIKI